MGYPRTVLTASLHPLPFTLLYIFPGLWILRYCLAAISSFTYSFFPRLPLIPELERSPRRRIFHLPRMCNYPKSCGYLKVGGYHIVLISF
ncbi:hypothetical protein HOY82DRAFT_28701 [Tuber indicum]|nr:hypothetical protein HOY82DRAFT_28701 [Tuber indicum]